MSGLKAIEQLLQTPELKLKQAADTRWLSHDSACQTLVKVLPAVITSLERESAERGQALAVGLCRVVKKYDFISTLYMMCDILPIVSRLSRVFQFSVIEMSTVDSLLSSTIQSLQLLTTQSGCYSRQLDSDLLSSLAPFDIRHSPEMKRRFQQCIPQKFLNALIENIKNRFPDTKVYTKFEVLSPNKLSNTAEEAVGSKYGEQEVQEIGKHYGSRDSPSISSSDLVLEWPELRTYMILNCATITMNEMLKSLADSENVISTLFPNFSKIAQVCLLLPLSTAECERAFSSMRRIKTRLRSQMNNATLNCCMRISLEGQPLEEFDFDKSLNSWSKLRNRRIIQ